MNDIGIKQNLSPNQLEKSKSFSYSKKSKHSLNKTLMFWGIKTEKSQFLGQLGNYQLSTLTCCF